MSERRSTSFALAEPLTRRDSRLASPLLVAGLGAAIVALLLAFHPGQQYVRLLQQATPDDPLTSHIAQGVLTEQPHQQQLYPTLIQAELRRNRFAAAADLARQWQAQARTADEAAQAFWHLFEARRQAWVAQPPDAPAREREAAPLREVLLTPVGERPPLPLAQRLAMAEAARSVLSANDALGWLPDAPPTDATDTDRQRVAQWLLGGPTPEQAYAWVAPWQAQLQQRSVEQMALYMGAAQRADRFAPLATHITLRVRQTRDAAQAGVLVRHLLDVSTRMDRLPQALPLVPALLDQHPALWQDRELLMALISAARASARSDLAAQWATRLLQVRETGAAASRHQTHPTGRTQRSARAPARMLQAQGSLWQQARRWLAWTAGPRWQVQLPGLRLQSPILSTPARAGAARARSPAPPESGYPLRFDDEAYALAYDAFVDHRAFAQAWELARRAVQAVPEQAAWRQRLAQVSEWHGQPQAALEQWLWLARQKDLPQAWDGILRLAPGLLQWDALRLAYERRVQRQPTPEHQRQLIGLLRQLGESDAARERLEQLSRRQPQPWVLDQLARLQAEQSQGEAAIATWRQLARLQPLDSEQAMLLSTLLIVRGELAQALAVQEQAPLPSDPSDRHDVLSMRLELARLLGQVASGQRTHETLERDGLLQAQDTDTLYALLERQAPQEASRLAARSWQRLRRLTDLQRALYGLAQTEQWAALDTLLADPAAREQVDQRSDWLLLLSQVEQARQRPAQARQRLEQALALDPDHAPSQAAALWLLIDQGHTVRLRRWLGAWEPALARDPRQHDLLAAAHLTLSQPGLALQRYLLPHAPQRQQEALWAMNLADALEQNGQTGPAWRVRQRLWQQLQAGLPPSTGPTPVDPELLHTTRARLQLLAEPGDRSLALLRELLREDAQTGKGGPPVALGTRLLVAAWLQDQGQSGAARAWLWQRAAQGLNTPLWFELSTALQDEDRARVGELLEQRGDQLTPRDRTQALRLVGDVAAAQTEAFERMDLPGDDEDAQAGLESLLLEHSHRAEAGWHQRTDRVLSSTTTRAGGQWVSGPKLKLSLQLEQTHHSLQDPATLARGGSLRSLEAEAEWTGRPGRQRLGLTQHEGRRSWQQLAWSWQGSLDRQTPFALNADWRQPGDIGPALRLGGWQHQVALRLQHRLSSRDALALGLQWQAYETLDGQALGSGRTTELRYTHWWRRGRQDLGLDAFSRHTQRRFNDRAVGASFNDLAPPGTGQPLTARFFAVSGSREQGLSLYANRADAGGHSRVWRPYGSLDLVHNSVTGWRRDLALGLSGPWLGNDQLHLYWRRSGSGTPQTEDTRQFGLDHRFHF